MNILMFSINPLFPDKVNGGSPKHLQNVAVHLGKLGHDVTILCTQRSDNRTPFAWHEKVQVKPVLKFKQPFPQPYDVPHYDIASIIQIVGDHLKSADRFYMHDGELLFPPIYQNVPTAIALRDNVYPETTLGSFLFQGDVLIAASEYSRQLYLHTAGRFIPELQQRAITINNGVDSDFFKHTVPNEILDIAPVDPDKDVIVLHPHRPEPSKGLYQTVEVVDLLVNHYKAENVKTLVPRWFEEAISSEVRDYYQSIETEIEKRGLANNFIFHDWIPQTLMPQYFSLGRVMLALGHFMESFGNTVYESLSCGTPAIASRITSQRTILPDNLLDKVHFGDAETAAKLAHEIITERPEPSKATIDYLHEHYSIEKQMDTYADAILNLEKKAPVHLRHETINEDTRFVLPPWCYEWEGGFYSDFLATHQEIEPLSELLAAFQQSFSKAEADDYGVPQNYVDDWYEQGYLTPMIG